MRTPIAVLILLALAATETGLRESAEAADSAQPQTLELASAAGFLGRSLRFVPPHAPPAAFRAPEAPLRLTASDGSGLSLTSLKARAAVAGPLAFTELRLSFTNPQDRVIEGQFRVLLPPGAAVSRFAMKLGDKWQEGEVVERQKARAAYEDFLHRRQDPALLEQAAGNEFSARVFPIPAKGVKELILSYSQELSRSGEPYRLALRGLPELGELDAALASGGAELARLERKSFVPAEDFVVPLPDERRARGARHGGLALARIQPFGSPQPAEIASLLILLDTSASRALGYAEQLRLVERLVGALSRGAGPEVPLRVACFDQEVEEVYNGTAGGFGDAALGRIRKRRALGASSLEAALRWAASALKEKPMARVIIVGDGVATAGAVDGESLAAAARALKAYGAERLDAVVLGGLRDESLLKRIVTAGLPQDGVVADGALEPVALGAKLTQAARSGLKVEVEGASWFWPKTLNAVQPGDEVLVYAELPEGKPLRVKVDGRAVPVEPPALLAVEKPLIERAWAQAKIRGLQERLDAADGPEAKARLQGEIVALSERHRVLSPYTALLVLETEEDYARYGIDRKALADILTLQDGRVSLAARGADSLALSESSRRSEADKAKRKSSLVTSGASGAAAALRIGSPALSPATDELALASEEAPLLAMAGAEGGAEYVVAESAEDRAPGGAADSNPLAESIARQERANAAEMGSRVDREMHPMEMASFRRLFRDQGGAGAGGGSGAAARAPANSPPPPRPYPAPSSPARPGPEPAVHAAINRGPVPAPAIVEPYEGKFKDAMRLIAAGKPESAAKLARAWLEESPGELLALVALGEALEAAKDFPGAARAYGSIIDLFPARADLRRFAGERLERLRGDPLKLAVDSFQKARESRPDHPAGHRLYAYALLKTGKPEEAFAALAEGAARTYPSGRFSGAERVLREDLGLVAAAWIKREPGRKAEILEKLRAAGGSEEGAPSLRFVLNWETDANDVDFHITDGKGGHAFYSQPKLGSGGELYADVTTGYGPECFTIRGDKALRAYPYGLQAHYYSRGPMGFGMGKLQIIEHDGKGALGFTERPFVIMKDGAYVDLGKFAR